MGFESPVGCHVLDDVIKEGVHFSSLRVKVEIQRVNETKCKSEESTYSEVFGYKLYPHLSTCNVFL